MYLDNIIIFINSSYSCSIYFLFKCLLFNVYYDKISGQQTCRQFSLIWVMMFICRQWYITRNVSILHRIPCHTPSAFVNNIAMQVLQLVDVLI